MSLEPAVRQLLDRGVVIPAHPLALTAERRLDEARQRRLTRYYLAAGAGGVAVGVHTTQFAIHRPEVGLYRAVLELAQDELDRASGRPLVRVAGIVGPTRQAVEEARVARECGFSLGLLSLAGLDQWSETDLLNHCRAVGEVIDVFGFYLQPAVGGLPLPFSFWRRLAELPSLAAIKIAAFNRYATLDVIRAMAEAGRDDVALYTGNDDHIVGDLVTEYRFRVGGRTVVRHMVGGLLGQWAVWTSHAVSLLDACHRALQQGSVTTDLLAAGQALTDANAAIFDVANHFRGCLPGIHEILRRQGLLQGTWCWEPQERLSPGQADALDRVAASYPHLADDQFVASFLRDDLHHST